MDQSLLIVHAQVPLYACDLHTSMLNRVGGIDDDVQPIYKCDEAPAAGRSWLPLLTFFCLEIQIDRKIRKIYYLANGKCHDRAVLRMLWSETFVSLHFDDLWMKSTLSSYVGTRCLHRIT